MLFILGKQHFYQGATMHQARLWKALSKDKVQCRLCSHFCVIDPGGAGKCGVRRNHDGELFTLVTDRVAALNLDPVEKKPLYHFYPGTRTFSLGTMGCNLACSFCQNASLSQPPRLGQDVQGRRITPAEIVDQALEVRAHSISYTYSEPTVFFELMRDTAKLALEKGLQNIMVSNGFMSPECLEELGPLIQAANIDLKAFTEDFYKERCGARLEPVLKNLKHIRSLGWWLEVTTLVIPGLNDSAEELAELAKFIHDELGKETPWHISRFHPCFNLTDRPPTPLATLDLAWEIGRKVGLEYVYVGNAPGHPANSSFCPECDSVMVRRTGFAVQKSDAGQCRKCGHAMPGRGLSKTGAEQ